MLHCSCVCGCVGSVAGVVLVVVVVVVFVAVDVLVNVAVVVGIVANVGVSRLAVDVVVVVAVDEHGMVMVVGCCGLWSRFWLMQLAWTVGMMLVVLWHWAR